MRPSGLGALASGDGRDGGEGCAGEPVAESKPAAAPLRAQTRVARTGSVRNSVASTSATQTHTQTGPAGGGAGAGAAATHMHASLFPAGEREEEATTSSAPPRVGGPYPGHQATAPARRRLPFDRGGGADLLDKRIDKVLRIDD